MNDNDYKDLSPEQKSQLGAYTICNTLSDIHKLDPPCTTGDTNVKDCYKKLALKVHPDKNPGDPAAADKFKQLSSTYTKVVEEADKNAKCSSTKMPDIQQRPSSASPDYDEPSNSPIFNPDDTVRRPGESSSNYSRRMYIITLVSALSIVVYNYFFSDDDYGTQSVSQLRGNMYGGGKGDNKERAQERRIRRKQQDYGDKNRGKLDTPNPNRRNNLNVPENPLKEPINQGIDITQYDPRNKKLRLDMASVCKLMTIVLITTLPASADAWSFLGHLNLTRKSKLAMILHHQHRY